MHQYHYEKCRQIVVILYHIGAFISGLKPRGFCGWFLKFIEDGRNSSRIFRYGRKYLESENAISIDPNQLPLSDRSHETPEGFLSFNGIRDSAPDKWGRYLLEKKFARNLSEIEFIAASSDDRVGSHNYWIA
jgi:hypothetical protein